MFYLTLFDAKIHINNNALNRTVTLSALFSSIKSVTRNLGGFFRLVFFNHIVLITSSGQPMDGKFIRTPLNRELLND